MSNTVRFGIVGLGNMGAAHARDLLAGKVPRGSLGAVCDVDLARLTSFSVPAFAEAATMIRSGSIDVILIATGSEVQLAVAAAQTLAEHDVAARVVSMPCLEWFEQQPDDYREAVLPSRVRARVAVEAGLPLSWWRLVGDEGQVVGIDHYGASADQATLFREFGLTADAVVEAAHATLTMASEER